AGDAAGAEGDEKVGQAGERGAAGFVEDEEQRLVVGRAGEVAGGDELLDEAGPDEAEKRPEVEEAGLGDLEVQGRGLLEEVLGGEVGAAEGGGGDGREEALAAGDEGLPGAGEGARFAGRADAVGQG